METSNGLRSQTEEIDHDYAPPMLSWVDIYHWIAEHGGSERAGLNFALAQLDAANDLIELANDEIILLKAQLKQATGGK